MGFGKDVQPLQIGQVKRVVLIVNVFDAIVLFNLRWIGQVNRIALAAQAIHQPIPVESGFHRHGLELRLKRLQKLSHLLQIAIQFPMHHALSLLVDHTNHYVVAVQVQSCN